MELKVRLKHPLSSFDLDIDLKTHSSRVGVLGASGAGKSMMLKMIAGIITPEEGYLSLDDRVYLDLKNRINVKPRKRKIGYLFQNYALFPSMTVAQNIGSGIPRHTPEKKSIISDMIERFHLTGLEKQLPGELSGGQQQRVALARILASSPDMILLDEPYSALDVYLRDQMQREILSQLESFTGPVFLVSHNRDEIYRFSDEILVLDRGKIIDQGSKKSLFQKPGSKEAAILTGCKNFSRVSVLDEHTFLAENWGVTVRVRDALPKTLHHIGYRAHDFVPIWGEEEDNCIPFILERKDELPFERNIYIRPKRENYEPEDVISWFVQRNMWPVLEERGMPDYLRIREEALLYF